MIKTFRGLLATGGQARIRLQTIKGKMGYRIVKFQIIAAQPFNATQETIAKIYKTEQSSIDGAVDFSESDLLAIGLFKQHDTSTVMAYDYVIFDNEIFNQDIYITSYDAAGVKPLNYYIELEVGDLSEMGAEYTTLKDIRTQRQ